MKNKKRPFLVLFPAQSIFIDFYKGAPLCAVEKTKQEES